MRIEEMIAAVQDKLGVEVDGKAGPETWGAIYARLVGKRIDGQRPMDALTEVDHFDRAASAVWTKATAGHTDDSSLLTLFLCIAVGGAAKTVLTEKNAGTLVRKIRKSGLDASLAHTFIATHAPPECQSDYAALWDDFLEESLPTLRSDMDYALNDALSLLRRECNIGP